MSIFTCENLGFVTLIYIGLRLSLHLLRLARWLLHPPVDVMGLGKWALVTGATDGIGKAYAFALAQKGLNIVLVSRSPFKLQNTAAEIESRFKVKTKIVDIDFTGDDREYLPKLDQQIAGLEVGVLVNNVGVSYEHPDDFLGVDLSRVEDIIRVNVKATTGVTRLVLPAMVKRGRGALVNVGSMLSTLPVPMLAVYSSSKAYVDKLSISLEHEYAGKGIIVQSVLPGYVVSKLSGYRRATCFVPTADTFVRSALSRLGVSARTTGYWTHDLIYLAFEILPEWLLRKLSYSQMATIRMIKRRKKMS